MGWSYSYDNTKKDEVESILRSRETIIDHSLMGNDLWILYDWVGERHLCVYMIQYNKHTRGYGHKGIDVCAGPYKYTCPKRLVDKMSPLNDKNDSNGWGRDWLKRWHEHRAAPKVGKWKVGDKFKWWDERVFEIISPRSSKSFYVHDQYGRGYQISTIRINRGGTRV